MLLVDGHSTEEHHLAVLSHHKSLLPPWPFLCFKAQSSDSTANPHLCACCILRNAAHPWMGCPERHLSHQVTPAEQKPLQHSLQSSKPCTSPHWCPRTKQDRSQLTSPATPASIGQLRDRDQHCLTQMWPPGSCPTPLTTAGDLAKPQTVPHVTTEGLKHKPTSPSPSTSAFTLRAENFDMGKTRCEG